MEHIYDVIILGGGPAGYTAALYATRAGLDTLLLEKMAAGGQMTQTTQIDNYPGFPQGIDGYQLGEMMRQGAERFGARTVTAQATSVQLSGEIKAIHTSSGTFFSKTVILATGARHKHLGAPNEERLIGRGVGYCAACDGMFYRGKTVAVVGGGNSAVADALVLSRLCQKVILIHRRDTLRATKLYHAQLAAAKNIEILWNTQVIDLLGDDRLSGLRLEDTQTGAKSALSVDGLFISIGQEPETGLFSGQLELENGYILADETTLTSLPGVFAAGDVRTKALRQIITAASDGAVAAHQAESHLSQK